MLHKPAIGNNYYLVTLNVKSDNIFSYIATYNKQIKRYSLTKHTLYYTSIRTTFLIEL